MPDACRCEPRCPNLTPYGSPRPDGPEAEGLAVEPGTAPSSGSELGSDPTPLVGRVVCAPGEEQGIRARPPGDTPRGTEKPGLGETQRPLGETHQTFPLDSWAGQKAAATWRGDSHSQEVPKAAAGPRYHSHSPHLQATPGGVCALLPSHRHLPPAPGSSCASRRASGCCPLTRWATTKILRGPPHLLVPLLGLPHGPRLPVYP